MANFSFVVTASLRAAGIALCVLLTACEKKGGEGVVLAKEYIPAAAPDQPVLKEHQTSHEQWKVNVEMRADLRKVDVLVEPAEWAKLKVGDRVNVSYSQGKYTGTIWSSEIK